MLAGVAVDLSAPLLTVVPSVHGQVLTVLAAATTPMSGRQIARLTPAGSSRRAVDAVLAQLTDGGVVQRASHPPAYLCLLNRQHLAAAPIVALGAMKQALLERIRRPDDLDPDDERWSEQLYELRGHVTDLTGNPCDILDLSRQELRARVDADDRLTRDLARDAIVIVGERPSRLLTAPLGRRGTARSRDVRRPAAGVTGREATRTTP